MADDGGRMERLRRLRELLVRRAAIRREMRRLDHKIIILSTRAQQLRTAA